ncbi:hypothetical protein AAG570_009600 [Ranatra chinensis]|uniref:Uncharacterized protein n=1 Tax=Ranatra chinensis TaxID=642074 RepID=A0ABD0YPS9_9HEMI
MLQTCILSRYCEGEFQRQYYPTYGVDFLRRRTNIQGDRYVTLIIWDVSGHAIKSSMLDKYLYGANIVLLVFDITNLSSFIHINDWMNAVRKFQITTPPVMAIIANKCKIILFTGDMEHQRAVSVDKQVRLANDNGYSAHSVSARTGENVNISLQRICAETLGIRLSRVEQEAQQSVVTAEIVAPPISPLHRGVHLQPSTICLIQ